MDILTIDFETYYDQHYSLTKVTTENYIRNELFDVIGVAVKRNDDPAIWFSGPKRETKKWLGQWDWANSVAVAHNAMFDMAILNWEYDIRPKRIADTLSMARAIDGPDAGNSLAKLAERHGLGAKGDEVYSAIGKGRIDFTPEELARYGNYCVNDVELTFKLYETLAMQLPKIEHRLIDLTIRMFSEPQLRLDREVLVRHLESVKEKKAQLLKAAKMEGHKATLMSNPQLAGLLQAVGVEKPPTKKSPTTGLKTWAFGKNDEAFKKLLEHEKPAVQAIVAARLGVKSTLEETRTQRFIDIADRGALPVPLRYYAAHTGRFGGDDKVNLQNLPRKSALKRAIKAPDGHVLIDCDSSQIEARTLAWLAGQDDLVEAFDKGEDVYKIMAAKIYKDKSVEEIDDAERFVGKTTILGAGYGMGGKRFQAQLKGFGVDMAQQQCNNIISIYRETYPQIPELWEDGGKVLDALHWNAKKPDTEAGRTQTMGRDGVLLVDETGIQLPNGLYLRYPGLELEKGEYSYATKRGGKVRIYGGKVVENVCQALARIIIVEQMLMISRRYKVAMTVHDSVVAIAPQDEAEEAQAFVEACMRTRPKWAAGLPLNCESKVGASYGG